MAGSLLIGIGSAADEARDRVVSASDALQLDDTSRNPKADMGPVIDGTARDRLHEVIDRESAKGRHPRPRRPPQSSRKRFLPRADAVRPCHAGRCAVPAGAVRPGALAGTARFAGGKLITWLNQLPYGNGATIFTSNGGAAREFARRIQCGMVGINVGVPAPMAIFPFAGWGGIVLRRSSRAGHGGGVFLHAAKGGAQPLGCRVHAPTRLVTMSASFNVPSTILTGGGASRELAAQAARLRARRALIVTDPVMVSSGLAQSCADQLAAANISTAFSPACNPIRRTPTSATACAASQRRLRSRHRPGRRQPDGRSESHRGRCHE